MNIKTFELERIQSLYENTVQINLTESGFHPYTLNELLNKDQISNLNNTILGYGQTNGAISLREKISSLYPNCNEDNILVTNGSAEANFIACHTLLSPGDEIIMMIPNYMQIWGIAEEMGCIVKPFSLKEEKQWAPDLDNLANTISAKTKMIVICNPNNPTGYVLSQPEMERIIKIADQHNCWIYCDEIYKGADLDGIEKPSFFGMYDKVVVNGGLSKAYALPGLRLGWLTGPKTIIDNAWAYSDYTSITAGILSHKVGEIVLKAEIRKKILARNISMLNENLQAITEWIKPYNNNLSFTPPKAGGMLMMKYAYPINSTKLSDWLRIEKSIFILPGDVYGMDGYFRIGIGAEKNILMKGLAIMANAFTENFKTL
ncbi:MAG: aminotransferase class I/II-fold pyridoxal phosphate-dependent enzyme [Bacteroidota bacterium]